MRTKYAILNIVGTLLCVLPPIIATLQCFPVWVRQGSDVAISGFSVILILLCCIPFHRQIRTYLKSPAMWLIWLLIFAAFAAVENIIHSVVTISFVGFLGNVVGAILFKWRDRYKEEK